MIDDSSSISSTTVETTRDEIAALPLWTFTLGVLALLTLGLTAVPAIICGHRALAQTKRSNNEALGKSVAVTGLVIGYIGVALLGIWITVWTGFSLAQP